MSNRVAIHHPTDPSRPTVIPASRYDPAKHRLWGKVLNISAEVVNTARGTASALPLDFPGRTALVAAGVTSLEQVRAIADFDEIAGIGQVTEQRIVAYLDALDAEDTSR